MTKITVKQGEAKWLKFTITRDSQALDLTGATFFLGVKESIDTEEYTFSKEDASFDKDDIATGIVRVNLTTTDLDISAGSYLAELKVIIDESTDVDKSDTFRLVVEKSIT